MSRKTGYLAAASVIAIAFSSAPAMANSLNNFSGTLSGHYANIDVSGGGPSLDSYGANGSGVFSLGTSGLNLQGDIGYDRLSGGGGHANIWNFAASPFMSLGSGRLGATLGYTSVDHGGGNLYNYGGYGEWFASRAFTVGIKAGGFSGSATPNGEYVGGGLTGYLTPNLALSGNIDYAHFKSAGHETDYTLGGEYLFSNTMPVSFYGGWTRSEFSGTTANADTFFVGFRFYTNGNGADTLVARHRTGTLNGLQSFGPLSARF
ncbi:MAG TPA: hypothetical protein VFI93_13105 [Rhizomicrobium sp.]|nr:hypothetical protein [Rhizomicrobium sp.]